MRLFSFDWFRSPERKKLQELQVEEQELKNEILKRQLEVPKEIKVHTRPFQKAIYSNGILTVIPHEGDPVSGLVDEKTALQIKNAQSWLEVLTILSPNEAKEEYVEDGAEMEYVEVSKHILDNGDFLISDKSVHLKGVELPVVPIVLASFIEVLEKEKAGIDVDLMVEQYEALKMFWRWTALNPIESSRADLITFMKNNDIQITANGLLEMYRRVDKVGVGDKVLVEFVSSEYARIRKNKKATGNYFVFECTNDGDKIFYELGSSIADPKIQNYNSQKEIGNLKDLYLDLPNMQENTYTDNYSHTKKIRLGEIYREDEDKIDLDNTQSCSGGLHVGGRKFGFEGAGDTGVMALVNPMKVRAVPVGEFSKMRVSEMFIVGLLDENEYKCQVGVKEIADFSQEYFNTSVEELEELLKDQKYEALECQGNTPAVPVENILYITEVLKQRVITI